MTCPSRFEGFGLTPMEGIAMGLPVIASDIPAHREFVGGAARFFPPEDPAALAESMQATRGEVKEPRGARTFASPLADLTIEACAARLLPRFDRLLRSAG